MSEQIKTQKVPTASIPSDKLSKVYVGKSIVEAITVAKPCSNIQHYKRIGGNACVNLSTGEHITFSAERHHAAKQSQFTEKFITLTYKEHMTDYKTANEDFRRFWRLFKYRYPYCEYIRILEPQQSGSWHIHILAKDITKKQLYVEYALLNSLWEHGRVWIKNLPFAKNFGAYFCVQFNSTENTQTESKATKKGKRIGYYPSNFKFYTCSKGIIKPQPIIMSHGDLQKFVDYKKPIYSYTNSIINNGVNLNSITYEQFDLEEE